MEEHYACSTLIQGPLDLDLDSCLAMKERIKGSRHLCSIYLGIVASLKVNKYIYSISITDLIHGDLLFYPRELYLFIFQNHIVKIKKTRHKST